MPSTCSVPVSTIPHSNVCKQPVSDCFHPEGLPELASHTLKNTASENAFANRYTKLGGSRRKRRSRRRRVRRTNKKRSNTRSRRQKKASQHRRGGVGYRFELQECPEGGLPHHVPYETH